MSQKCTKVQNSELPDEFQGSEFTFDALCYEYTPLKGVCDQLSQGQERLLLDLIYLQGFAMKEDYIGVLFNPNPNQYHSLSPFSLTSTVQASTCPTELRARWPVST